MIKQPEGSQACFSEQPSCLLCADSTQASKARFLCSLLPSEVQGRGAFLGYSQLTAEMLFLAMGRDASSGSWCGFLAHSSGGLRVQLLALPEAAKFSSLGFLTHGCLFV